MFFSVLDFPSSKIFKKWIVSAENLAVHFALIVVCRLVAVESSRWPEVRWAAICSATKTCTGHNKQYWWSNRQVCLSELSNWEHAPQVLSRWASGRWGPPWGPWGSLFACPCRRRSRSWGSCLWHWCRAPGWPWSSSGGPSSAPRTWDAPSAVAQTRGSPPPRAAACKHKQKGRTVQACVRAYWRLRHYLRAQSQGHHTVDRLEESRGVKRGSARRSSLKGRERAVINQANTGTVSNATLGKLLRETGWRAYGLFRECIWAFPPS